MTIYVLNDEDGDIGIAEFDAGDVGNLEGFERDLNDTFGVGEWAYDREDLEVEDES